MASIKTEPDSDGELYPPSHSEGHYIDMKEEVNAVLDRSDMMDIKVEEDPLAMTCPTSDAEQEDGREAMDIKVEEVTDVKDEEDDPLAVALESEQEHDTEAKRAKRGSVQLTRKSASNNSESSVKSSEPSVTAAVGPTANSSVPSSVTQSSPKQELVSRSGRKIKPKKFLDEESFEGGPAGGSEVNGSPKTVATPKASADGEGKQGSLHASKMLSVKGSTAALQSEHSSPAAADEQLEVKTWQHCCRTLPHCNWTMSQPKKQVRTLHERLKIVEEVEKNPGKKRVDIAKRLGLAPSTLNSIFAKKDEIREQAEKCGKASKKRKIGRESTFAELESVLITWYQQARASNIPIDGTIIRGKAKMIAAQLNIENFTASNGWIARFKDRHGLVYKKFSGMNKDKFEDCVSVDSHMATCGVETVQELSGSLVASGSVEGEEEGGEEEDGEPEVVPSFAETHEALMKVKSFFYAHSTSDSDRESVLGLEKSYFELRSKVCTKQTSMKDFLSKK